MKKKRGDMAKLVDATDLIGLSLGMETYQVRTFKFRETLEFTMGNPEPNPIFEKQRKIQKAKIKKKDRCRDSMEAVLTNGVDDFSPFVRKGILLSKFQEWIKDKHIYIYVLKYYFN